MIRGFFVGLVFWVVISFCLFAAFFIALAELMEPKIERLGDWAEDFYCRNGGKDYQ